MKPLLALGAAAALITASVVPYVRSKTGQGGDAHCLAWPAGRVEFHASSAGAPELGDSAFEAIDSSLATWAAQMGSCGNLTLAVGPRSTSRVVGFEERAANENLILFRTRECTQVVPPGSACFDDDDCGNAFDCWDFAPGTLAITTTNFAVGSGQLLDADIEINAASHLFTTVDAPPCNGEQALTCVSADVQNTVTHELGHAIGLAHSPDGRSTMFAGAQLGETSKRALDDGSREFVCTAYPQGQQSRDCDGAELKVRAPSSGSCGGVPVGLVMVGGLIAIQLRSRRGAG